ncbi:hypothetical protein QFW77_06025 [Luteimonas sp. RD2P54]|uniref:EF-hand domain-containing protein n=1 Tax=Luteimonas endophytica TaxID=3042023 RepID=A0ABT6J7J0_9GAMM|nr:hypothetical protein [Luteimonas endophytica]MDH5822547.1 hypothetical protein [Luteimonas endophytica]
MRNPTSRLLLAATLAALSTSACAQNNSRAERFAQAMQERFTTADTNRDGRISRDEASAGMPRVAERFDALDTDSDGQLSRDELRAAAQQMRAQRGR